MKRAVKPLKSPCIVVGSVSLSETPSPSYHSLKMQLTRLPHLLHSVYAKGKAPRDSACVNSMDDHEGREYKSVSHLGTPYGFTDADQRHGGHVTSNDELFCSGMSGAAF